MRKDPQDKISITLLRQAKPHSLCSVAKESAANYRDLAPPDKQNPRAQNEDDDRQNEQ